MTQITIPPEFYEFASDYALDAIEINGGEGLDDMIKLIDNAIQYHNSPNKRAALHNFFNRLLEENVSNEELQRLWRGSNARLAYDTQSYHDFFAAIRDRLAMHAQ